MDEEAVRLNGQRLLHFEFVAGIVHDEIKSLEDGNERDLSLLPRKCTPLHIVSLLFF